MSKKEHTFQTKLFSDCPEGGGGRGVSRFPRLYPFSGAPSSAKKNLSPPLLVAAPPGDQKVKPFD